MFPNGKYKTIYVDPPRPEHGGGRIRRGADRHYKLMTVDEIRALPIPSIVDPDGCHLYLWTTNAFLPDALDRVKVWGFHYVTLITWCKDRMGLGQYFRGMTEHCIFATTKKKLPYKVSDGKRMQGVTGFIEPKREHSRKPEAMRQMIERVSYAPRIELFAREAADGWAAWGDQLEAVEKEKEA